ncbi:aminotransferase [Xylogone sp. PMI_703]|nr:aminotransferase [Xylogone sp. PMI_703]
MEPDFMLISSLRYDPSLSQNIKNSQIYKAAGLSPGPFYMLPYHRDRLLQAAEHFNWTEAASRLQGDAGLSHFLRAVEESVDAKSDTPLRIRIVLHHDGKIVVETFPAPPVPMENLFPTRIPPPAQSSSTGGIGSSSTGGALTLGPRDRIPSDPQKGEAWPVLLDTATTTPSSFTSYKTTKRDMYSEARKRASIESLADTKEVLIVSNRDNAIMEGSITSVFFWRNGKWVTPPASSGGLRGVFRRWALEKGISAEEAVKVDSLVDGEEVWLGNGVKGLFWGKIQLQ